MLLASLVGKVCIMTPDRIFSNQEAEDKLAFLLVSVGCSGGIREATVWPPHYSSYLMHMVAVVVAVVTAVRMPMHLWVRALGRLGLRARHHTDHIT